MTLHRRWFLLLALLLTPLVASAQLEITLKNSFIEQFHDRATITANFTVDKAHKKANPPAKDADLHVAGRAPEIGLATVAELMNARTEQEAMDAIHEVEGTTTKVKVTGAWRLWAEHGGGDPHVQGKALSKFTSTNPDHIFEIHPVTRVAEHDARDSLAITDKPIAGFKFKRAEVAFPSYENIRLTITPGATTTKLTTGMAGFNYVEFIMKLLDDPIPLVDGQKVFASVFDLDEEMLVRKRRMIFIKDTPPEIAVRSLHAGDRLHVVGVPRVNLTLLRWRLSVADERPEVLEWNLPYELVIVGVINVLPPEEE